MSTNRVLQYLRGPCSCCSRLQQIERKLETAAALAEQIEHVAAPPGLFEFWLPEPARVLNPKPDDELDGPGIRLIITEDLPVAGIDDDLTKFAVDALRELGQKLLTAAARIQSAFNGGAV